MGFSVSPETGDGSTTTFTFAFTGPDKGYFRDSDVHAFVKDAGGVWVEEPEFTLVADNIAQFAVAPGAPTDSPATPNIQFRRIVSAEAPYSDFSRGNNFGKNNMNYSFLQQLYLMHQLFDESEFYLKLSADSTLTDNLALIPPPEGNKFLQWNPEGTQMVNTIITKDYAGVTDIAGNAEIEAQILGSGQTVVIFANDVSVGAFYLSGQNVDSGRLVENIDFTLVHASRTVLLAQSYPAGTKLLMAFSDITPELALSMDELSDADTSTVEPVVGEALVWDGANWVPSAVSMNLVEDTTPQLGGDLDLNGHEILGLDTDATLATKTLSMVTDQETTLTLSKATTAPSIAVTKEVPQLGLTDNTWDVDADDFTFEDFALATTLTPSAVGEGTFALGTGSFTADNVGMRILGNGGEAVLTATDGSYSSVTEFDDTSAIASGGWVMYGMSSSASGVAISGTLSGYSLENAVYTGNGLVVADALPRAVSVSTNGAKLYYVGDATDLVYQYSMSEPYDLSTATYDSVSFDVSSETTSSEAMFISNAGDKLFILSSSNETIYQYSMSTPWDLSTLSYDSKSFSVSSEDTVGTGMCFSQDGTKLYYVGLQNTKVYQYTLGTPWDISTAGYDSKSLSTSGEGGMQSVFISDDGMLIFTYSANTVYQYALTVDFDLSTASYDSVSYTTSEQSSGYGLSFANSGKRMYVSGNTATSIFQYGTEDRDAITNQHLPAIGPQIDSTFWADINSMTATEALNGQTVNYALSNDDRTTWSVSKAGDGVRNIVRDNAGTWELNEAGEVINWYYDVTGDVAFDGSFSIVGQEPSSTGIAFNDTGSKVFIVGTGGDKVHQYSLSTLFTITSGVTYDGAYSVATETLYPAGLSFNSDGSKLYTIGYFQNEVHQYSLTTPFDVTGTVSYDGAYSIAAQDTDSRGIVFNTDGTRMYHIGKDTDVVHQYSLTTPFDVTDVVNYTGSYSFSAQETDPRDMAWNNDGTRMYICGSVSDAVNQYIVATPFDVTGVVSFEGVYAVQDTSISGITFNLDGSRMFCTDGAGDVITQYSLSTATVDAPYTTDETWTPATTNTEFQALSESMVTPQNAMDSTQLAALGDDDQVTLGTELDLAMILYTDDSAATPLADGVAIDYDANVKNEYAILGTDYDAEQPASDTVIVKSLGNNNLKIRVV